MNTVRRIAKNTLVLLVAQVVSLGLGFFYMMYTARYLGAEGFGVLSFALAFTGIFGVFADMGLNTLTTREIARDKSKASKYLGNIAALKAFLVAITLGLIIIVINLQGYPEQTIKVVYLVALSIIFTAFIGLFNSVFQAFENMEFQSIGAVMNTLLMFIGILIAIKKDFTVVGFASIYFFVNLIVLVYSYIVCRRKFFIPKIEYAWSFWKQSIKEALPLGGMAICIMIYFRIDTVMLSLMKDDVAVGLYSAAYRLSEMSTTAPAMFVTSIFPVMSRYHKESTKSFVSTYERTVKFSLYLALPMALIVTLLAKPIINLIYGNAFSGSIIALQILIWSAAIMFITMMLGNTIILANKQMISFKFAIIAACLNIILNIILIPKYSYIGASAATVATEAFGLFVGFFILSRYGYKINIISLFLPPIFGLFIAVIISILLISLNINIYIISIITVTLYALIIYKLGTKESDKELIKNMLNIESLNSRL